MFLESRAARLVTQQTAFVVFEHLQRFENADDSRYTRRYTPLKLVHLYSITLGTSFKDILKNGCLKVVKFSDKECSQEKYFTFFPFQGSQN